jgi:hypothetical protein
MWLSEKDNVVDGDMETLDALVPVAIDKGDISERADVDTKSLLYGIGLPTDAYFGESGMVQRKGAVDSRTKGVSSTIFCLLVRRHVDIDIEGECSLVWSAVEGEAGNMHVDTPTNIDLWFDVLRWERSNGYNLLGVSTIAEKK